MLCNFHDLRIRSLMSLPIAASSDFNHSGLAYGPNQWFCLRMQVEKKSECKLEKTLGPISLSPFVLVSSGCDGDLSIPSGMSKVNDDFPLPPPPYFPLFLVFHLVFAFPSLPPPFTLRTLKESSLSKVLYRIDRVSSPFSLLQASLEQSERIFN